ncbi:hypothetical protein [Pseudorhodoferax sp. Leaf274]|uniref:hypothetical protein n=1 Tax=Pseudorhodoferax sp. Leaf274 TaxID=1736318 RepID=UPI00070338D9|nr:hypothetical protein [Pseudorhodoferax sp. Leaf274]KQP49643.1 hypothetical protein ASF44_03365 [Pseudorhodoferax sp. Leaf274]
MDTATLLASTPLAAGQTLHLAVEAGTVLVAVQGDLRIDEAPHWLADTLLPVGCRIGEGQTHVVTRAGWVRVAALREARLEQVVPVGPWPRLVARLAGWARTLRLRGAHPAKV